MISNELVKLFTQVLETVKTERVLAYDNIAGTKLVEENGQYYIYFRDLNRGTEMKFHFNKENKMEPSENVLIVPGKVISERKLPFGKFYTVDYNVVATINFHENCGNMQMTFI